MQDLGIQVLFRGTNFLRLWQGLWVSLQIAVFSMAFSMLFGVIEIPVFLLIVSPFNACNDRLFIIF